MHSLACVVLTLPRFNLVAPVGSWGQHSGLFHQRSGLPTVRNIAPPAPRGQDSPFPSPAPNPSEHLAVLSDEHLGGFWLPPTKCP